MDRSSLQEANRIVVKFGTGILTDSRKQLDLMREIKKVFDPNNILNAGKVIPA